MRKYCGAALLSILLLAGAAIPAAAAELMRVTFVRHGESAGNASGLIDTTTPGPVLTPLGQQQAEAVVGTLGDNNYDAIYGSTMVRTQLTAAPMSQYLRLPIRVLPGVQEIEAGIFEGTPESEAQGGYGLYPLGWTFPGVIPQIPVEYFNKSTKMPGTEQDGYAFDARVDGALKTMYDNGDRNSVVFSHGGTIMFWTMMNAKNLTVQQKLQLLQTAQLDNTDYVVIEGNPEDGWTLVNWNGQQFGAEPTLGAETRLQFRTLTRQLAATAKQVVDAFGTRNIATIANAINRGIADAVYSVVKFQRAVGAKVIHELEQVFRPAPPAQSPVEVSTARSASTDADTVADDVAAANTPEAKSTAPAAKSIAPEAKSIAPAAKSVVDIVSDEATPTVASTVTADTDTVTDDDTSTGTPDATSDATSDTGPAQEPATALADAESEAVETSVATNGATDLKDGNKVVPGQTQTRPTDTGSKTPDLSEDVSDQATTSVEKAGDTGTTDTGESAGSRTSSGPADTGAGGGSDRQKDAA